MSDKKTQKVEIEILEFEGYEFDRISYEADIKPNEYVLCGYKLGDYILAGSEFGSLYSTNARIVYKKKAPYKFWLPGCGMPKPTRVPEDLEWLSKDKEWLKSDNYVKHWNANIYRWREDVPMEGDQ